MMRRALTWMAALLCAVGSALGAQVTCSVSAVPVAFGIYDPLNASALLSSGSVVTTCTVTAGQAKQTTVTSSFTSGSSGTYVNRTMLNGANPLLYNLYLDAAYTKVAGDGTGGSSTGSATLSLTNSNPTQTWTETIYGSMPASQDAAPGTYTDSIMVTVNY